MSEQFLQAWAIDLEKLSGALGGRDDKLVRRALASDLADEVCELLADEEDASLEAQLTALVAGKKLTVAGWHTLRCIAVLADTLGTRVDSDITLPGRGWQALGPAWKHWKLPTVGKLWSTTPAFAKKFGGWPHVMAATNAALPAMLDELAAFDPASIVDRGVPADVERFGEGEWPLDLLAEEIATLQQELTSCAKAARRKKRDLALWLDGQQ